MVSDRKWMGCWEQNPQEKAFCNASHIKALCWHEAHTPLQWPATLGSRNEGLPAHTESGALLAYRHWPSHVLGLCKARTEPLHYVSVTSWQAADDIRMGFDPVSFLVVT